MANQMLLLLGLVAAASGLHIPEHPLVLGREILDRELQFAPVNPLNGAAFDQCNTVNFNYCQAKYSERLGLDPSVNWRQAEVMLDRMRIIERENETMLLTSCVWRSQFYQCLGAQYYNCVSLYNLYNKAATAFSEMKLNTANSDAEIASAQLYVYAMRADDFTCNEGFEEGVNAYECLLNVLSIPEYAQCRSQFNTSIVTHDVPFCDAVATMGSCYNNAYAIACPRDPHGAGWFGCEMHRQAYIDICQPGKRCFVH